MNEMEIKGKIYIKQDHFNSIVLLNVWPDQLVEMGRILTHLDKDITVPAVGKFYSNGDLYCACISPGQYVIFRNTNDVFSELSSLISINIATLTDLTHARCAFYLKGPQSVPVLNKGLAIDLSEDSFPVGSSTQGVVHSISVLLSKIQKNEYLIMVPSSLAISFSDWILDAAIEYS